MKTKAKPFLKWVGGKGQLLAQFENYYPNEIRKGGIETYCEPFLGGGAVFFEIMQRFDVTSAYISDVNKDLILAYWIVQQKPEQLIEQLERYQKLYDSTEQKNRNDLFLSVREQYNEQRFGIDYTKLSDNWVLRAAQLIFLNKTCFNGLFRLNSKGGFNVPYGKYPNPAILDESNIWATSEILNKAEIQIATYDKSQNVVDSHTFMYLDPPYRPLNKTSNFTGYAGSVFSDADQQKLAQFFKKMDQEKNAKIMLSNSDPKNEDPNDAFFEQIFSGYNLYNVSANRAINSNPDKRGAINELVITNYQYQPQILTLNF